MGLTIAQKIIRSHLISGDMTPMMFVEARKYAQFGTLPTRKGW